MNTTIQSLQWRYATKQYDPTKKLSAEAVDTLLESIRLSPSSFGLQPYKIFNITNPDIRTKLRGAAWDQTQVTDASHVLVFTVPTEVSNTHVDTFIELTARTRGVSVDDLKGYAGMIKGSIASRTKEQNTAWAARQAYIALGILLATAALEKIDATPMEGFDSQQFDEILGLKEKNLTSVVIVALGHRHVDDKYASLPKVRASKEELFGQM